MAAICNISMYFCPGTVNKHVAFGFSHRRCFIVIVDTIIVIIIITIIIKRVKLSL
jgi:hypothetical protein